MSISRAENRTAAAPVVAADEELVAEQREARARAHAAQRRSKTIRIAIRVASLVVVLGGWEYFGRQTNPILFTYPTAVPNAAAKVIAGLATAVGWVEEIGLVCLPTYCQHPRDWESTRMKGSYPTTQ